MEKREINDVVFDFIKNMDALNQSMPLVLSIIVEVASKMTNAYGEYLEKYGEVTAQDDEKKIYSVPIEKQSRVNHLREKSSSLRTSIKLLPRNFLVSFVSEFDCFLGALLKVIYIKNPELLNDSERKITYTELLAFDSLKEAKEQILEKEVESILRKSHAEQFLILENKFNLKLKKGLKVWSEFIEIAERRNLFVHSNGIVSSQYLKVCSQHGVDTEGIFVGDKLTVDSEYLKKSYNVIYEVSVKLAHVLWRKIFPGEREIADKNLNDVCFDLVSKKRNKLASVLLEFAISLPKHHSDTIKRIMIINLAQAYKRSDCVDKCIELLSRFDWSATGYEFKLAISVLNEEYEKASSLLKTVVTAGDISEKEVVDWPLFIEFRETDEFLAAFKELFDKDYAQQEELIKEEFDNHMNNIFNKNFEEKDVGQKSVEMKGVEEVAEKIEKELEQDETTQ